MNLPPGHYRFQVIACKGTPRPLHPIVRDEVFRIAGEALRNALRHSAAKQIEVELRYDVRQLRMREPRGELGIPPRQGSFVFSCPGQRENSAGIGIFGVFRIVGPFVDSMRAKTLSTRRTPRTCKSCKRESREAAWPGSHRTSWRRRA